MSLWQPMFGNVDAWRAIAREPTPRNYGWGREAKAEVPFVIWSAPGSPAISPWRSAATKQRRFIAGMTSWRPEISRWLQQNWNATFRTGKAHPVTRSPKSESERWPLGPPNGHTIATFSIFLKQKYLFIGVGGGIRTLGHWNHNPALYQLSYTHREGNQGSIFSLSRPLSRTLPPYKHRPRL